MNLFVVPSWYPSNSNPISGVFIKEQLEAIAELNPNIRVIVSKWGHDDGNLYFRRPKTWLKLFLWALTVNKNHVTCNNGIYEIFNPCITSSIWLPFSNISKLIRINRKNFLLAQKKFGKINIIHGHVSYPAGFIASRLSVEFNIPYVITEHMGPFPFSNLLRYGKPINEIEEAFKKASVSIAVSSFLADKITDYSYNRPLVIPNMVNENLFHLSKRSPKKTIFFTLSSITIGKGIDDLLEAIYLWNPSPKLFEFRIAGNGNQLSYLKDKAANLGLNDRIIWMGEISRSIVPDLFKDCSIFVLPSKFETFGIVYAEAIACGKPIIATRCGGPESIVNSDNGLLVDVGDIAGLASAMQHISENLNWYDSRKIRIDFEKRFSRKEVTQKLTDLYQSIINKNSSI